MISIPVVAMSLRLRATLLIGVTRIFQQQVAYIIGDLETLQLLLFKSTSNAVTLADPVASMKSITIPEDFTDFQETLPVATKDLSNFSADNGQLISFRVKNVSPEKQYDEIELARGSNTEPNFSIDFFPRERQYPEQTYIGPSDIVIDTERPLDFSFKEIGENNDFDLDKLLSFGGVENLLDGAIEYPIMPDLLDSLEKSKSHQILELPDLVITTNRKKKSLRIKTELRDKKCEIDKKTYKSFLSNTAPTLRSKQIAQNIDFNRLYFEEPSAINSSKLEPSFRRGLIALKWNPNDSKRELEKENFGLEYGDEQGRGNQENQDLLSYYDNEQFNVNMGNSIPGISMENNEFLQDNGMNDVDLVGDGVEIRTHEEGIHEEELDPRPRRKSTSLTKTQKNADLSLPEENDKDANPSDQKNLNPTSVNRTTSSSTSTSNTSSSIGDQVQVSENTAKMLKFYKNKQTKIGTKNELKFASCLTNVPRKVTAKAFFHTMELASVGLIEINQTVPYGDIFVKIVGRVSD